MSVITVKTRNSLILILILLCMISPAFAATKATSKKAAQKPKAAQTAKSKPSKVVEWAAKVNGDIISMDLYNKRFEAAKKQILKEISIEAAEEKGLLKETRKDILEQMMEAVILLQWAEREGIEIKDKAIKMEIQALKKTFPSGSEFHKSLAEQGMTLADLERDIKKQIIIDRLISMRAKAIAVTDEEMKAFYDKNIDLYVQKEKLHLSQIFHKDLDDAKKEKANLENSGKFLGDDIGLVSKDEIPVYDTTSLFSLKPDDVTGIVSGEEGYYIFKVLEKVPAKEAKFEGVKDSIRKFLLKEKARMQYLKDLQEEKANAKIIINEKLEKLF